MCSAFRHLRTTTATTSSTTTTTTTTSQLIGILLTLKFMKVSHGVDVEHFLWDQTDEVLVSLIFYSPGFYLLGRVGAIFIPKHSII